MGFVCISKPCIVCNVKLGVNGRMVARFCVICLVCVSVCVCVCVCVCIDGTLDIQHAQHGTQNDLHSHDGRVARNLCSIPQECA